MSGKLVTVSLLGKNGQRGQFIFRQLFFWWLQEGRASFSEQEEGKWPKSLELPGEKPYLHTDNRVALVLRPE